LHIERQWAIDLGMQRSGLQWGWASMDDVKGQKMMSSAKTRTNAIDHLNLTISPSSLYFVDTLAFCPFVRMMQQLQTCPKPRWLREALLFVGFFTLNSLTSWDLISSRALLGQEFIYFCLLYGHAQVQRFFVLPKLLDSQQTRKYAALSVAILLSFSVIMMQVNEWLCTEVLKQEFVPGMVYLYAVATATVSLLLFNVPLLINRFYDQRRQQEQSKLCMQEMELSVLRSQLNPHFLFNTLNNLYGVSLHEPSRTPDMIMQLSQLLRYQLESTRRTWVPLTDELEFLESYVALETGRVGSRCRVHITGLTNQEPDGYVIAPMLLMPFVENAFKHGTAGINRCEVEVSLRIDDQKLYLHVVNSVPFRSKAPVSTGVGLDNTRQRLEMLYPGTHELTIQSLPDRFVVNLMLPLRNCKVERLDPIQTEENASCLNMAVNPATNDDSRENAMVRQSDHPAQIHL
jgi:two-component system, LytTR family, sensor kinase